MGQVTSLLVAIGQGQQVALAELYTLLYPKLHRLAHSRIRRSSEITLLDTTALLHESFLRFEKSGAVALAGRDRFMAYAARELRSVVRYFGGMTEPEIAAVLGLTAGAVARDWEKARLFLHTQLR